MTTLQEVSATIRNKIMSGAKLDKIALTKLIRESVCSGESAMHEFRLCMGATIEDMDSDQWAATAVMTANNIYDRVGVRFTKFSAEITIIEVIKHGYFFFFMEVLKKIAKDHGLRHISLRNSAEEGFWAAQGFTGPDEKMTYVF